MLLQVLIPVYNHECLPLVADIRMQLPKDCGIIVGDDCSTDTEIEQRNSQIAEWEQCIYWRSEENLGRAAIRNRLADLASAEYLLFIDCDAMVCSDKFISNYLSHRDCADVVCGGTGNLTSCPSTKHSLRYKYEIDHEKRMPLSKRQAEPYSHFTTFNFMIKHAVFNQIRFCEGITGYGHEDTYFGLDLKRNRISILHIENKLIHTGIEENASYMDKVDISIRNLQILPKDVRSEVKLSDIGDKLNKSFICSIIREFFQLIRKPLRYYLISSSSPSLTLFNVYRLGEYMRISRKIPQDR